MDFVAIDFETANEHAESACALGIADVREGRIVEQASWLIRPPDEFFRIKKKNREIHGIGRPALKDKEQFDCLWPRVRPYFENRIVVAHSTATTELPILRKLFAHFSIEPPEFRLFCTLRLAKASWYGQLEKHGLENLARFLGCQFSHHDPKDDAMVCAKFLLKASEDAGVHTVDELAQCVSLEVSSFALTEEKPRRHTRADVYGMRLLAAPAPAEIESTEQKRGDDPHHRHGFDDRDIERRCADQGTFTRGSKLYRDNKIFICSKDATQCSGFARGTGKEPYEVRVDIALNGECNCNAWINSKERFCKHCVALALLWKSEGGPTPFDKLTASEKNIVLIDRLERMPPKICKELMLELVAKEPALIARLLFDEEVAAP